MTFEADARWMMFVDGENFLCGAQESIEELGLAEKTSSTTQVRLDAAQGVCPATSFDAGDRDLRQFSPVLLLHDRNAERNRQGASCFVANRIPAECFSPEDQKRLRRVGGQASRTFRSLLP
jgi:hypothetical protein